ncbi:hypothetical protein GCM10007164_28460 [Luteimonas padinae]|mgnify:CR=1 FL=1|uniref:Uncharacterized protein n=1 Tax=Luteimonas padinae TaxID=1714359 RepID=A0ABV6SVX0_9GAMM|nr:hypothetical protein [Luteimonas padinae]GHD76034.1 hypothetical protein GCM10007164_28460 [Luteimonas padinae]
MKTGLIGSLLLVAVSAAAAQDNLRRQQGPSPLQVQVARGEAALDSKSDIAELKAILKSAQAAAAPSSEVQERITTLKAQWLAASGFSPDVLLALEASGHDVSGALERDINGTLIDYALLSETVVVGTLDSITDELLDDGFLSTVSFKVDRTLKGNVLDGNIKIRQRSGLDSLGYQIIYDTDFPATPGSRYLLFLSSGLYDVGSAQKTGKITAYRGQYYVPQRSAFLIRNDGTLEPIAKGIPPSKERAEEVIDNITSMAEIN